MSTRLYRKSHLVGPNGITGVSAATLYRWIAAGKFPPPIHIGERVSAWLSDDVHAWLDAQKRGGIPSESGTPSGFNALRGLAVGVSQ